MISISKKFIYVHYPKTAGNSIQNNLAAYADDEKILKAEHQDGIERFELKNNKYGTSKHSTINKYYSKVGAAHMESMFVFSTIRNPWDRMISFYFSPHRRCNEWNRKEFVSLVKREPSFDDFVCLKDGGKEINRLNYLIKYESLEEDYKEVTKLLNIEYSPLTVRNASKRDNYRSYYDDELVDLVACKFKFDIELGNYEF